MKAMVFSIIRMITAAFVLALMFLTLEADNIIHVIFSFPIFLIKSISFLKASSSVSESNTISTV